MSRRPEETIEQWYARATPVCQAALEALEVESTRLGLDQWFSQRGIGPGWTPGYCAAMDALDLAEDERMDVATAMVRERQYSG